MNKHTKGEPRIFETVAVKSGELAVLFSYGNLVNTAKCEPLRAL